MMDRPEILPERFDEAARTLSDAADEGKDLESALLGVRGVEGAVRLSSRQGTCFMVRLAGSPSIFAKLLSDASGAGREQAFSEMISEAGISCPKVQARYKRAIARAYIEGRPASDELDAMKQWGDAQSALKLSFRIGSMLALVHAVAASDGRRVTLEDANLRNFIVSSGNTLSVIDLADAGFGDQAEDLGGLLVHILTHRPAFSQISWEMAMAAVSGYTSKSEGKPGGLWFEEGLRRAFLRASIRRSDESLLVYEDEAVLRLFPAEAKK